MKRFFITLLLVGGIVELSLLWMFNPSETNIFIPCLFWRLTGLKCPSCGLQRSIHLLLHGHLVESITMCPFVYFLGAVYMVMWRFPNITKQFWFPIVVLTILFLYSLVRMMGLVP